MQPTTPPVTSSNSPEPRTPLRPSTTPRPSTAGTTRLDRVQFSWNRHGPWVAAAALAAGGLYLGAVALLGWVWGSVVFGGAAGAALASGGRVYRARRRRRAGGPGAVLGGRPGARRAGLFGRAGAGTGGRGGRLFGGLGRRRAGGPGAVGGPAGGRRGGLRMPWSKGRNTGPRAGARPGRTGGLLGRVPGTRAWKANRAARRGAGLGGRPSAGPGRSSRAGGGRSLLHPFGGGRGRSGAGRQGRPRGSGGRSLLHPFGGGRGRSTAGPGGGRRTPTVGGRGRGGPARFIPGTAAHKARTAAKKAANSAGSGRTPGSGATPATSRKPRWWSKTKQYGGLKNPDGPQAGRRRRRDTDPGRPHLLSPKAGWWERRRSDRQAARLAEQARRQQALQEPRPAPRAEPAPPRRPAPPPPPATPVPVPSPPPQTRPRDPRGQDAQPQRPGGQRNMAHEIETPQVKGAGAMQDAGLYAALLNLAPAGEEVRAMARKFRGLATQMSEEQPAHPAVAESLAGMATVLETAAGIGAGLWPEARGKHEKDFERAEQPRGGRVDIERKADVGRAADEGAI